LIRGLAEDLAPRPRLRPARTAALGWLLACGAFVGAATLATGPLRPGALRQLVSEPGFALDVGLGLLAGLAAIAGVMRLRIPGRAAGLRGASAALLLFLGWLALQGGAWLAADAPGSTLGARPGCWLAVLLFGLPPFAVAVALARRAAPLERAWTGALAGLAAGALGALAMEFACMRDPAHALVAHLTPAAALAAAGAALAPLLLRRI
jgi:hypothetical protein